MKKKLMIGLIAGTAVFAAVFGAAATLGGITTEDLGADSTTVASCDSDSVTTSYTVAYDGTLGGYKVSDVTVGGIDATACNGQKLNVTLSTASGSFAATEATIDAATEIVTFAGTAPAKDITGIHVSIKG